MKVILLGVFTYLSALRKKDLSFIFILFERKTSYLRIFGYTFTHFDTSPIPLSQQVIIRVFIFFYKQTYLLIGVQQVFQPKQICLIINGLVKTYRSQIKSREKRTLKGKRLPHTTEKKAFSHNQIYFLRYSDDILPTQKYSIYIYSLQT